MDSTNFCRNAISSLVKIQVVGGTNFSFIFSSILWDVWQKNRVDRFQRYISLFMGLTFPRSCQFNNKNHNFIPDKLVREDTTASLVRSAYILNVIFFLQFSSFLRPVMNSMMSSL